MGGLSLTDIGALELVRSPLWIYDLDRATMWWANAKALKFFCAPDLATLKQRFASNVLSTGMRRRLATYREGFLREEVIREPWTFYPKGSDPVTADCVCSGVQISDEHDDRLAMMVEARINEAARVDGDERRLVEALRHCNERISLYTLDGALLLRNPSATQMFGAVDGERGPGAFGKTFVDSSTADAARQLTTQGGVFHREVEVRTESGNVWHDTEIRQVMDPVSGEPALLAIQHDVSLRRNSEIRLEEARVLAVTLRERAENANNAKSAFLAIMSHELRTPMTGVLAAAEILRESDLSAEQEETLGMVLEGGRQMVELVDDVLHLSRIEAGHIEIESMSVALRDLLESTLLPLQAPASRKGLRLSLNVASAVPNTVMLDPRRVRQVLTNLVANAIKHTDEGGIDVSLSIEQGSPTYLVFEVADSGTGIAKAQLGSIFAPFEQVGATHTRTRGSAGLGLHVAQLLTLAMGGQMGVESELGNGSRFWFRVLLVDATTPATTTSVPPKRALELKRRVVIADDNTLNRKAIARFLRRWGCEVFEACDGAAVLETIQQADPDVVLMDIDMPVMDGVTATRHIRAMEGECARTPIIALTADAFFAGSGQAQDTFNAVLYKPVDWAVLHVTLSEIARKR